MENGLELFPSRNPADQKMKLVQAIDTKTCTYELALSFKPDVSIPFINYPSRPLPDAPDKTVFTDVPDNFHDVCDAEGYDETLIGTADSPLSPENHVGLNKHYTEYSYTIFTDATVAKKTGFKDVVLGSAPCGQGSRKFPSHSVHFYTKSKRDERKNYRCKTGGGFFCKPTAEQCSDRAKKFQMDGNGLICNIGAGFEVYPIANTTFPFFKNLPPGWVWTTDDPISGRVNAAAASQGLHSVYPLDFSNTLADIPQHLLLNYDGELIANHVILWSGFSKGLSRGNKFTREFNFNDATDTQGNSCKAEQFDNIASSVTSEYNPETGRTTVTARGSLQDCSGPSFTKVIDHSNGDGDVPDEDDKGTCGHQKITLLEAPTFIRDMKFAENANATSLRTAGDYSVFQDNIFTWEEVVDDYNSYFKNMNPPFPLFTPFGLKAGKLVELAGEHRGSGNYIRNEGAGGPGGIGGFSPSTAVSDIKIDHPDYGSGTVKVFGYSDVFGEGVLSITGGTGDFEGAYGTIKPSYGLIIFDQETIDKGLAEIDPGFIAGETLKGEVVSFGFFLSMDFRCNAARPISVPPPPSPSMMPVSSKSSKHSKAVRT